MEAPRVSRRSLQEASTLSVYQQVENHMIIDLEANGEQLLPSRARAEPGGLNSSPPPNISSRKQCKNDYSLFIYFATAMLKTWGL